MNSLWDSKEAEKIAGDDLALRVYTSRLLGQDEDLVMHGGGNTSVKSTYKDFFGREVETLFVKGSGWDLKTIEKPGFAPLRLKETCMLAELESLTDDDMAKQLRAIMLDQSAPSPSVEAILHAIMPFKFVDHTHTDAVVTLTNTPKGESYMKEIYPDCLILPYIMPGFILAKQVYDALKEHDLKNYKGIVLLHHGVFTYDDDPKIAYENMIELVSRAEDYIQSNCKAEIAKAKSDVDLLELSKIRKAVSTARKQAQLVVLNDSAEAAGFASLENVPDLASRGPITPDHVIRTKRTAAIIGEDANGDVQAFVDDYKSYYDKNSFEGLTMLDPAPRWAVWKKQGTLSIGSSLKECGIITDIIRHTAKAIQTAEGLGGWEALPAKDIFDLEYWVLEQAKLSKAGKPKTHQGKVAIVSGAAGGIGLATAEKLAAEGAVVVGLDINAAITKKMNKPGFVGKVCDLSDEKSIQSAVQETIRKFGGLDIAVVNAGIFKSGEMIDELGDTWDKTMDINLTASQRFLKHCIPYLKNGIDASIIIVGSRNVTAPGAGAAAYSVSKAGLTQLGRVAALELSKDGVRVNTIHPDAVFDTELWTDEALAASAKRYNMTVEEYKTKNLLSREIKSSDIANLISSLAGDDFIATTGAQIPVDGGNDRVI